MTDNQPRILIVEDNLDNRVLLIDMLGALGYRVIEAIDGIEGVERTLSEKPDLVLMDLSLPRKDGWVAARELKSNAEVAHIPIIALTAHAMVGDRDRALEAGCDDYIPKPINLAELSQKIETYLSKTRSD